MRACVFPYSTNESRFRKLCRLNVGTGLFCHNKVTVWCLTEPTWGLNRLRPGAEGQEQEDQEKLFREGECWPYRVADEENWMWTRERSALPWDGGWGKLIPRAELSFDVRTQWTLCAGSLYRCSLADSLVLWSCKPKTVSNDMAI